MRLKEYHYYVIVCGIIILSLPARYHGVELAYRMIMYSAITGAMAYREWRDALDDKAILINELRSLLHESLFRNSSVSAEEEWEWQDRLFKTIKDLGGSPY